MLHTGIGGLSELVASICWPHLSSLGQKAQFELYRIDKIPASDRNALSPFIILAISIAQKLSYPTLMILSVPNNSLSLS